MMTKVEKQNKILFYIKGYSTQFLPKQNLEKKINALRKILSKKDLDVAEYRVDYYNKLSEKQKVTHSGTRIKDLKHPKTPKSYYFDTYEYARYFDDNLLIDYAFGDVNTILPIPMITKSRPIAGSNENNILLKLDKARHFVSVDDRKDFNKKNNLLIGRGGIYQEHRIRFFEKHFENPLCDIGQVNLKEGNPKWIKPKMTIDQHLDYKFILSLEGTDVATNLKWIMSSNSIAIAPPHKMETWYMEGTLIPNEHFIQIADDFSDLDEKLEFYTSNPKAALEIVGNAKRFRSNFNNENLEDLIALLVLKKYFEQVD